MRTRFPASRHRRAGGLATLWIVLGAAPAIAQTPPAPTRLPAPSGDPLRISAANDPVLAIGRAAGPSIPFRSAIAAAVARNPALAEAAATRAEASAARREARAGLFPSADLGLSSYRSLARNFANDPDNAIERLRSTRRTDATLSVDQTVIDFGATSQRIEAASARLRAAAAGVDSAADDIALRTIAAWYDIFAYRTLLGLDATYVADLAQQRENLATRVRQGVSAEGDFARLDSVVASVATRVAGYRRQLAGAEARFAQLTGARAPAGLGRAPLLGDVPATDDAAHDAAVAAPAVAGAQAQAAGARQDARAARSDALPKISAGLDAGRYGVFENSTDYDVRARISLRKRFGGGVNARVDQVRARAAAADARAARIREEAGRDAAIAWSDRAALDEQIAALEQSYLASRRSRDVLAERFRVARGDLFDVLAANTAYFDAAASYIEALSQRDAAHYVLLSRTGRLLPALGITSAMGPTTP